MVWVIDNLVTLVREFFAVATSDPLSALLMALGGLFTGVAAVFFGYLTVRGLLSAAMPDIDAGGPPEPGH